MSRASQATRAAAARAVASVLGNGRSLDAAMAAQRERLQASSYAMQATLCYGVLRHRSALEWMLGKLMRKPLPAREREVQALLLCGIYELWQLSTPPHAAVAETVGATAILQRKGLRGLCNGVLRSFMRQRETLLAQWDNDALSIATRSSHPQWLVDALRRDWPSDWQSILDANNIQAPMWLRVNRQHTSPDDYAARLKAETGVGSQPHVDAPQALLLDAPVAVDALPGFADGHVSVQDLAPQLVGQYLQATAGMRVLDACAAPGGKAAHLQELADNQLDLTALDIDERRLGRVRETFERLALDAHVLAADASQPDAWWDGRAYDRIVIDAPCTATGVIRRHPDIKWLRRESDVAAMATRQLGLLEALWPLLADDGCLLFATCSVLRAENHAVIGAFCESTDGVFVSNELRSDNRSGLMRQESWGLSVLPGVSAADGFFISRLTKKPA